MQRGSHRHSFACVALKIAFDHIGVRKLKHKHTFLMSSFGLKSNDRVLLQWLNKSFDQKWLFCIHSFSCSVSFLFPGACLELVWRFEQWTFYTCSLGTKLNLTPQSWHFKACLVPNVAMNLNKILFIQTSTLPPHMHPNPTLCMWNNLLPTKTLVDSNKNFNNVW